MKKIALLNDFKEYAGAEVSIQSRLACVPPHLTVDFKLPTDDIDYDAYDAFILENVTRFGPDQLKPIIYDKPYVKVEHDYGYCLKRNLIDCRNCDMPCPAVTAPVIKDLFEKAKVVISQSPAHMRAQQAHLAGWKVNFDCCLTMAVKRLPENKWERKKKTIGYLGTLWAYKGIYEDIALAARKSDYHLDIAGRIGYVKPPYPQNVTVLGPIEDKWKFLAEHEYFIHLPRMLDPCPATVTEAILMGCKIIYNANVGNISFPYKTRAEWIKAAENADTNFWKKITNIFNT